MERRRNTQMGEKVTHFPNANENVQNITEYHHFTRNICIRHIVFMSWNISGKTVAGHMISKNPEFCTFEACKRSQSWIFPCTMMQQSLKLNII